MEKKGVLKGCMEIFRKAGSGSLHMWGNFWVSAMPCSNSGTKWRNRMDSGGDPTGNQLNTIINLKTRHEQRESMAQTNSPFS